MAEYRVEPDCLLEDARTLSAAADAGPSGAWPSIELCASPTCDAAFDEAARSFGAAWRDGHDGVADLTVQAVQAADAYREVEARAAAEADRQRQAGSAAESAGGS